MASMYDFNRYKNMDSCDGLLHFMASVAAIVLQKSQNLSQYRLYIVRESCQIIDSIEIYGPF